MVTTQLEALLKDLEPFFKCKLEPDVNNSCLIKMKSGLKIQLELDREGNHLIIGARLGTPPPGRYRELVAKEALKSNTLLLSSGIFGYSKKSDQLIFFINLKLSSLNQEKLFSTLTSFIKKAQYWTDTLKQGNVPIAVEEVAIQPAQTGLFGLMH